MTEHIIPLSDYELSKAVKLPPPQSNGLIRTPLSEIMATEYPPISWAIEGYVPEGFSVLAGRQKLGKTWLALDWSLAIGIGGYAMGDVSCQKGNVLYLDLENGHRRIKRRIEAIYPDERHRPKLDNIEIVTDAPALDAGLIQHIDTWRQQVANPRLVVIDVLQRVKPAGHGNRNAYENDYQIFSEMQRWATDNGIAVVGLHHTRKGGADDPLEALSGSNGLSACADTTLVLDKDQNGMTLYVRGRDVEERETALRHSMGCWEILGSAEDVNRSTERSIILTVLQGADEPMTLADLVAATGMKRNNLDQLLYKLGKDGTVQKAGRGKYIHGDRQDLKADPVAPDKIDKKIRNEGFVQ
jgi:hypothetical protein